MPLARNATGLLAAALSLAYPVVVYFGLTVVQPRLLGLGLLAVLLLRHGRSAKGFLMTTDLVERAMISAVLALSVGIVLANSEFLLRLYPCVLSLGMFLMFARTLIRPPSMIERFARLTEPDLSTAGVHYTRRVTQVWCVFLAGNGLIALASAFASRELWVLWNGLLSYLLMGTLFAGEWLVRRRVLGRVVEHA
ncbi:MAG TPA: hypothetical protein PLW86_03005 [Rhodocyclaceae bacterium]|nr:hypothetical protein [Rhodocyclaceae bacterium]